MRELEEQLAGEHPDVEVWAGGGLIMRDSGGELEILLVHRPHRSDWSFPKGKVDDDESLSQTAEREVEEETGFRCRRLGLLPIVRYTDGKGREKLVAYWTMEILSGTFEPNDEVDSVGWFSIAAAAQLLSYERDIALLDAISPPERQLRLLA